MRHCWPKSTLVPTEKESAKEVLSYTAKVQFNGNLMVGKAYTALLDLERGDEFEKSSLVVSRSD